MENSDKEKTEFDLAFEIECVMYSALKATISDSIDKESRQHNMEFVVPKEQILKNLLSYNLFMLEEACAITPGPNGRIYLCGKWLMRPILSDGKMIPMMEELKKKIDTSNVVFCPAEEGSSMRMELWGGSSSEYPSYNLSPMQKLDTFNDDLRKSGPSIPRPFGAPPFPGANRNPNGFPPGMAPQVFPPDGTPRGKPPQGFPPPPTSYNEDEQKNPIFDDDVEELEEI